MASMIISSIDGLTALRDVHGGTGTILWKVFALGGALYSDLDTFEYCCLPPGAVLGDHIHSRSEEIYFITAGRGQMHAGDDVRNVGPGDLVVTPLGGRHGIANTGDVDLEFVCAEVMPPSIASALPAISPVPEGPVG